jgi:hypothetical protein
MRAKRKNFSVQVYVRNSVAVSLGKEHPSRRARNHAEVRF